ncbi:MAG: insulinase family protein, partial [Anaerolineae bacterium]|nr:insulinase family protein [Anaerolineae bacterium]
SLPNTTNITRVVLNNGIVILVYENFATQSVVMSGSLGAGSLYEQDDKSGLAAMTANALMRGTQTRDFTTIATMLEDIGADVDVSAGVHRSGFGGKGLAEDMPILIDLLADVLRQPAFPTAPIERLRGETLTGLQIRSQDTRYRARRAFHQHLYPHNHPYHYSVSGSLDTVPNITIDELKTFHAAHYGPDTMVIGIVGAVKASDAIALIRAALEDWHNPNQPAARTLPQVEKLSEIRRAFVPLAGKTQSDIVIGSFGPSRYEPDYLAAMLVNCVLGQFGMSGRIGETVREDLGLAYYAHSSLDGGMGPTPWRAVAGVNPANIQLAIERIIDEIRRITDEPVSDEDLANVQSFFVGRLPLQLESNEGIAGTMLNMEIYDLGLDYLLTYRERIYALSKEDLLQAARHYLNPDAYVLSISGPETD